jgi:D-3-phosphoglycerate dehydrogenase / 2-oxoglutarate reductase
MRFVCPDLEADQQSFIDDAQREVLDGTGHHLRCRSGPLRDVDEAAQRVEGADGVLLNWTMPSGVLTRCPSVRVVSFAGTGVERYIDLAEARERGVTVCNVPSYGANAVAEHAFALIFAVARNIVAAERSLRAGRWEPTELLELRERRLGVVGAGHVGARVIEIGRALGMDVAAWTRTATRERATALGVPLLSLEELFRHSDVVSLHVAHTPETENLVDARLLELLPPGAILVNTARAEVVDARALVAALEVGRLRGAGVDVFSPEPPAEDDPLVRHPGVVATPHVAYFTAPAAREMYRIAVGNLVAFAAGTPRNVVA